MPNTVKWFRYVQKKNTSHFKRVIGVKRFANFLCYCVQLLVDTLIIRSSRLEVSCKTIVVRNFAKFTGKHLFQSLFFNKIAGLMQEVWLISRSLLNKVPWVSRVPKYPSAFQYPNAQVVECSSVLKAQVTWSDHWVSFDCSSVLWVLEWYLSALPVKEVSSITGNELVNNFIEFFEISS